MNRKQDTLRRLEEDEDVWVASADPDGNPYLVPLSFLWDGAALILATLGSTPTGRNLRATGRIRIGLGLTRDVVMIDGSAEPLHPDEVSDELGDAFLAKAHFDPRKLDGYLYFRVVPTRIQAWGEEYELKDREILRNGTWLI
ncbi:pyridoxamine 5'-phosphate oxidase family protein [Rhizohabitans arisaemae]|uniref:pyridoxamine 5'-phosphate oxidase family protein n=1 Tax=Rhizohabitans arisaemae TaxID=2720610 RepID=UPI0024B240C4|nr:pyridoxamine 5'-phosphate oxidase family protein [Rhizohabitans arisaemae]